MSSLIVSSTSSNDPSWIFKNKSLGITDGNYTSCELLMTQSNYKILKSNYLVLNNFGFTIPVNSVISGFEVNIRRFSELGKNGANTIYGAIADNEINFIKPDGSKSQNFANNNVDIIISNFLNYDNNKAYFWDDTVNDVTYGNKDELFGLSITPEEMNNENFSISMNVISYKPETQTLLLNIAYIDSVCVNVYYTINGIQTGLTFISSSIRNTKFDTNLKSFGEIPELIYSKVNEKNNPLKIQHTEEDKSIYPMIDEFGYTWENRFI